MKTFLVLLMIFTGFWQTAKAGDSTDIVWMKYTHDIVSLQFSNDDSKILTVGNGGVRIFETLDGSETKVLPGGDACYVNGINGELIFTLNQSKDSTNSIMGYFIQVYNALTYDSVKRIDIPMTSDYAILKVSQDGQNIAVANSSSVTFIDFQTGLIKKVLTQFGDESRPVRIKSFLFSKDGQYLIISMGDPVKGSYGEMMYINTQTYKSDYLYNKKAGILTISDDGTMLAFQSYDESGKAVTIMNTQTHEIINSIPGNAGWVASMAFSKDGKYLVVSWQDKVDLFVYNVSSCSLFQIIKSGADGSGGFFSLGITNNNRFISAAAGPILALFEFLITGISDEKDYSEVLYPNPITNSFTISFNLPILSKLNFNLYDLSGSLISNLKFGVYESGLVTEQLVLGNLPNGTYFLKVESLQFNKTFKIILNK